MSTTRIARARVAALTRHRPDDDDDDALADARRQLKASRAEAYINKLVDSAPPLTDEQRDRLVGLLKGAA